MNFSLHGRFEYNESGGWTLHQVEGDNDGGGIGGSGVPSLEEDTYERWLTLGVMMPMVLALYLILILILYSMCCRKSREQILLERLQQVRLLCYIIRHATITRRRL